MRLFIAAILAAGWMAATARGDAIHVNNRTGDDANDGQDDGKPVASLERAVALAGTGDSIVLVNTGTPYGETLSLAKGGTPAAPLVVEGNGAVLSGLKPIPADQWRKQENGTYLFPHPRWGALRPYLVEDGRTVPRAERPDALAPGQHCWTTNGVYFRPAEGRDIADCVLAGTLLVNGVGIRNASYITIRNLTCEYFANDGFNVHGECRGIACENIVSRHNGDDGFSIHEDVGASVRGGHFYDNDYGIQDVNASRSTYNGVLVESNRLAGVHFCGGVHALVDAVVRDNGGPQVRSSQGAADHIGFSAHNPIVRGLCFVKNAAIRGGRVGLQLDQNSSCVATHCVISGVATGITVSAAGTLHLLGSVVYDCRQAEVSIAAGADAILDGNLYFPGRLSWQGRTYEAAGWEDYRAGSGQDANSRIQPPPFSSDGILLRDSMDPPLPPRAPLPGLTAPAFAP